MAYWITGILILIALIISEMTELEYSNKNVRKLFLIGLYSFLILLIVILKLVYEFVKLNKVDERNKITRYFKTTDRDSNYMVKN